MVEVPDSGTLRQALEQLQEQSDSELRRARAHARAAMFGDVAGDEPLTVGRYRLLANVGQGGLGNVWAAHDPHLDRVVALKLLRDDALRRHRRARAQLLAEAAIMARLTHPNVVRVYDLGEVDGELFVAMEYVEGQTLRAWQTLGTRGDWRTLLEVYLQAGEGLAAAHDAGLVHGDFKPDNVLIGNDGRVLVSDFAVTAHVIQARAEAEADDSDPADDAAPRERRINIDTDSFRTLADSIAGRSVPAVGTPAYMAPEQLDGKLPDASSDQFAYCVALWEALTGERPFLGSGAGATFERLREAIREGPRELERERSVPARVLSTLRRGLAERPEDRYPELAQLLADLRRHLGRRRRLAIGASVLALVLATGAGVSYGLSVEPSEAEPEGCPIETPQVQLRWPEGDRTGLAERLAASPLEPPARTQVLEQFDAFVERWGQARQRTCVYLALEGDDGVSAFHDRALCMYAAATAFTTSVEILLAPEAELLLVAQPVAGELPDPLRCVSTADELHTRERDPSLEVRRQLARAQALQRGQRLAEALAITEQLRESAEADEQRKVLALVELQRGMILERMGRLREALRVLERAQALAEVTDELQTEVRAAIHCAAVHMKLDERPDEIEAWAERSIYLAQRLNDPAWILEGKLMLGYAALRAGDGRRALEIETAALAEAEAGSGLDSPALAYAHDFIGAAHGELGQLEQARAHKRKAIELIEQHYGPDHLDVAALLLTSASIMSMLGERDEARAQYERAHELLGGLLGPTHPRTRAAARQLSGFLFREGEAARAEALLGNDHSPLVELMRAQAAFEAGELARASTLLEHSKATLADSGDPRLRVQALELEGRLALALADPRTGPWTREPTPERADEVILAEARYRATTAAETISVLAELLEQPRFEVRALSLAIAVELSAGQVDPSRRAQLERLLDDTPGLSAEVRAWTRVVLWRAAADDQREAATEQLRAAVRRAYGAGHPLYVELLADGSPGG